MTTDSSIAYQDTSQPNSNRLIGLIGLGLMGIAIAHRLRSNGCDLIGWDVCPDRRDEHRKHCGTSANNVEEIFERCDCIILSLPSDDVVVRVLAEVQTQFRKGQRVIDTSTGDPQATIRTDRWLSENEMEYLDATVSGSSVQLFEGSAVMLVGASEKAFVSCKTILQAISPTVLHVGPTGSGTQMKLVTNLVLGLNRAALAEGLAYARALGLPLGKTLTILRESMAYSRIMDTKGEKMVREDFTPQAKLSQHAKDVGLMVCDADRLGLQLPLTKAHQRLLQQAIEQGLGDQDNSAIIEVYGERGSKGI
jgi:3-hydroxyisobutyrate dehydrogenase-like beta-hydroxyacid dehydrogenase